MISAGREEEIKAPANVCRLKTRGRKKKRTGNTAVQTGRYVCHSCLLGLLKQAAFLEVAKEELFSDERK